MLSRLFRAGPASMVPPILSAQCHWPITATSLVFPLVRWPSCAPAGRHDHGYTLSCAASLAGDRRADKTEWQLTIPHPKEALR